MRHTFSIEIDAPPERVFAWLDDPQRALEWVPNLVENENLEMTPDRVGSTFRQVYLENGRRMEMHGVTTHFEPNRRLTMEISGDTFDLFVDYGLEDLAGRTRLTQTSAVRFKGFFKLLAALMMPLIKGALNKQLEACFGKLKRLVENDQNVVSGQ